jgi:Fe-S cluster assembly scaffold protein SufB
LSRESAALVPARTRHERFGWLNDAFATDVARLVVDGTALIEVVFAATPGAIAQAVHPRLEVSVQDNADLVLVERHVGSVGGDGLLNVAVQVHGAPGSRCRHLRWQALAPDAQLLDTLQVALDRDTHYSLALLQLGSRSAAARCGFPVRSRHCCPVCGVSVADERRTIDMSLLVDHIGADTSSSQVLRALARERARLAWRSRVG